jgi:alkanesulfonate monooxygenase SsuD/methylene tetrahydromethanopterin reductase-like flavin-dependent oxidoreductase (luciferase family)
VAALTSKALEQAGEIADGIMPVFWPASRVMKSQTWIERGQAKASGRPKLDLTLGLPTFVGDNLAEARGIARQGMSTYAAVPAYQRLFQTCGFEEEASAAERGATFEAISDRLLDASRHFGSKPEKARIVGWHFSQCFGGVQPSIDLGHVQLIFVMDRPGMIEPFSVGGLTWAKERQWTSRIGYERSI